METDTFSVFDAQWRVYTRGPVTVLARNVEAGSWHWDEMVGRADADGTFLYYKAGPRYTLGTHGLPSDELDAIVEKPGNRLVLPLYAYVHGGTLLSLSPFSCPWDSAQCGLAVVDRNLYAHVRGWESWPADGDEQARKDLQGMVDMFNAMARGDVWEVATCPTDKYAAARRAWDDGEDDELLYDLMREDGEGTYYGTGEVERFAEEMLTSDNLRARYAEEQDEARTAADNAARYADVNAAD